jgi:endonuclease III
MTAGGRRRLKNLRKLLVSNQPILAATLAELTRIAKLGGIHEGLRAQRLKEIALIALNEFDGDLSSILKLPRPKAIRALKQFPSIGDPGAEKMLLFAGAHSILALDSNGMRVLLRLGFGEEKKSYTASYKSVQASLENQIGDDPKFLIAAHQLLRQHGQELCKRSNPRCAECPLRRTCEYFLQTFKSSLNGS